MNCKNCGNQLIPGEKYCRVCGKQVDLFNPVSQPNQQITNSQNLNVINNNMQQNNTVQSTSNYNLNPNGVNSNVNQNSPAQKVFYNQNSNEVDSNVQQAVLNPNQINNQNLTTNYQNNMSVKNNENIFNKYKLFFIIGTILIVIIVILLVFVLKQKNKDGVSVNEYETNITDSQSTETVSTTKSTNDSDSYTFMGFKIAKLKGYTYEEEDEELEIYNSNEYVTFTIVNTPYNFIKNNYSQLQTVLESQGYTVKNLKITTNNNIEYITAEVSLEGYIFIYFVTKANDNYVFDGSVVNRNYKIDYSNLDTVSKIIKNSSYVGNYDNYSTTFGTGIKIDNHKK